MNDRLKIETILGNAANANPLRASRDGGAFEGVLPAPGWTEIIVKRNGSVTDTVNEMKKLIASTTWQTAKLAPRLKGKSLYDTCRNVWSFLFTHIKYQEDDEGKEQLRTPARSWEQRRSRGIDCDDFSIFCGSILYNLKIPFYIRIARYKGKDYFQHVYPVVPYKDKQYITIDAVLNEFDAEKEPAETKDFLMMNTNNLNGVDISVLGGIEDDTLSELSGILSGADFDEVQVAGFGSASDRELELGAIRRHLVRTRNLVARRPDLIRYTEQPQSFLGQLDYALKYWDSNKREDALGVLEGEENRLNELEGMGAAREDHEDVELFYGLNGLGSYNVLGKAKRQRKFFSKVKQAVKKAGQGIKKIAKKLVRFNPLTVTIRAAVLLALKVNLLKVASKFKWGYLTEQEAQSKGFDMNEWRKVKGQLAKAEKLFVDTLQGKAENFKRAILNGRAGKLSGPDLGLGVVVAAGTAASTAAATPFITKILNLLKNINFKKLLAKVNPKKLQENTKEAEADVPTEDGGTSIPENPGTESPPVETSPPPASNSSGEGSDGGSDKGSNESSGGNESRTEPETDPAARTINEETNDNPGNLPVKVSSDPIKVEAKEEPTKENMFTKLVDTVKANPTTSLLIGAGAVFLIGYAIKKAGSKKRSSGLGRAGRGKKRKGKAKRHLPRTISGTPKNKSAPKKKTSRKRKGKPKVKSKARARRSKGRARKTINL